MTQNTGIWFSKEKAKYDIDAGLRAEYTSVFYDMDNVITSYSIHYTKLYEVMDDLDESQELMKDTDPDIRDMARDDVDRLNGRREEIESGLKKIVITSYSIHYTKLYDSGTRPDPGPPPGH